VSISYDAGYGTPDQLLETRVRIATWNIWGRYGPWAARMAAITETLRRVDADIVCLQEVWDHGGEGRNQARELADTLGYAEPLYAHNLEWPDGTRSGNAILARWPRRRDGVLVLPRRAAAPVDTIDEEGEERLCLFAELDGPRGPIQMYCAHLSWRGDHGAVRRLQVAAICDWVKAQRPRSFPAVLCGDLNAPPDSDEIRMLTAKAPVPVPGVWFRDAWTTVHGEHGNDGSGNTWSNDNPFAAASLDRDTRIDYVMVGAPKAHGCGHVVAVDRIGDEPIEAVFGSDHYGLVAELRY
jgi:endonuclease/exonuclease/phosphatase family metal-dependent hydrolase